MAQQKNDHPSTEFVRGIAEGAIHGYQVRRAEERLSGCSIDEQPCQQGDHQQPLEGPQTTPAPQGHQQALAGSRPALAGQRDLADEDVE